MLAAYYLERYELNTRLHKKQSFPLRISSVNVKVTFAEEILNGKLHFLCSASAGLRTRMSAYYKPIFYINYIRAHSITTFALRGRGGSIKNANVYKQEGREGAISMIVYKFF